MKIKHIALDFGGVLGYKDLSFLTPTEKILLEAYLNQNNPEYLSYLAHLLNTNIPTLLKDSQENMQEIYFKAYKLYKEIPNILEKLIQKGYTLSIWTNNTPYFNQWFTTSRISDYIPSNYICNSYYYNPKTNKPELLFYRKALEQISYPPEDILFIDDSPPNIISANTIHINASIYQSHQDLETIIKKQILKLERRK